MRTRPSLTMIFSIIKHTSFVDSNKMNIVNNSVYGFRLFVIYEQQYSHIFNILTI